MIALELGWLQQLSRWIVFIIIILAISNCVPAFKKVVCPHFFFFFFQILSKAFNGSKLFYFPFLRHYSKSSSDESSTSSTGFYPESDCLEWNEASHSRFLFAFFDRDELSLSFLPWNTSIGQWEVPRAITSRKKSTSKSYMKENSWNLKTCNMPKQK